MSGETLPEAILKISRPASGYAVVGNGWSVHSRFPSDAVIRTHLDGAGRATVMRAAGSVGAETIWRPEFTAFSPGAIRKAKNPNDLTDFEVMVERNARRLTKLTDDALEDVLPDLFARLNSTWVALPPDQRDQVLQRVLKDLEEGFPVEDLKAGYIGMALPAATTTIKNTAKNLPKMYGYDDLFKFGVQDERAATWIAESAGNYVTTLEGQISKRASGLAKEIVGKGFKEGLGPDDIAVDLQTAIGSMTGRTTENYGRVVSSTFTSRARSYGQLASMRSAGIQRYKVEAVLDIKTSETCRFLHGKMFDVAAGLQVFDRLGAMKNPKDIVHVNPWSRVQKIGGEDILAAPKEGGGVIKIAQMLRSGAGKTGDTGAWKPLMPMMQLPGFGVAFPPYHGGCRSTTVPVMRAG